MSLVVGYAGLTHLGLNYAVAGAAKGFDIIGYDPNPARIYDVIEPALPEALETYKSKLHFTDQIAELSNCDIVYIAPDVVTDDQGQSDLTYIKQLLQQVIAVLNGKTILVVLAQVPPGFTSSIDYPAASKFYQVETLVFGQAVQRALYPERFIVGCAAGEAIAPNLQQYLAAFDCPILPMRYESAELAKIAINCCLVASIGVANSLAEICEKIGADWSEIVPALRLDKRIGEYAYLKPGLGIAGGNLERDLATVVNYATEYGTDKTVIQSLRTNSVHRRNWPLKVLFEKVLVKIPQAKIAIWGLTYKENTHSLKNSPALHLLADIAGRNITAFDPVIKHLDGVRIADSALQAVKDADVLVIMTPWAEFKAIDPSLIAQQMRGKVVIDPYAVLDDTVDFEYFTLGKELVC